MLDFKTKFSLSLKANGLKKILVKTRIVSKRPLHVKASKAQIHAKFHEIPTIRSEDQRLKSFSAKKIAHFRDTRQSLQYRLHSSTDLLKPHQATSHHHKSHTDQHPTT